MELSVISHNAHKFLAKCEECRHGGGGQCLAPSPPPSNLEIMMAFLGGAQDRPRSRQYAARLAAHNTFTKRCDPRSSSWWETWISLDKPCDSFCPAS